MPALEPRAHRLVHVIDDRCQPLAAHVAFPHGADATRRHGCQTAQASIARELGDVGLHLGELIRELLELLRLQVEERVALEEFAAAGQVDVAEALRHRRHASRERRGGLARALGGGGVDDDEEIVVLGREHLEVAVLALLERQIGREEGFGVAVDAEVLARVDQDAGGRRQHPAA